MKTSESREGNPREDAMAYRVKRWIGFDGPSVSPVPKGPVLFERVRASVGRYVRFAVPWAWDIYTLSILQAYSAADLPACFYVLFSDTKGRGKTTALDIWAEYTGGLNASDISTAALVHHLADNQNGAIAIDEVDVARDAERDAAITAVLRNGYTRGKPYLRWDPVRRQMDPCPTYGAKAIGFRGKVDDALEDRGFTLPLGSQAGLPGAEMVTRILKRERDGLPKELEEWGKSRGRRGAVLAEMDSPTWQEKIAAVVGAENLGLNRETQLTNVTLAVCRGCCIDLTDSLRAAFGIRREVAAANTDLSLEDAKEVLAELGGRIGALTRDSPLRVIRQSDFVRALDARRIEGGQRKLTSGQVAQLRNDLGIRTTWLTHPKNKATWNIPVAEWDSLLGGGVANPPNPPNLLGSGGGVSRVSQVSLPLPAPESKPAERQSWLETPARELARPKPDPKELP
jgi:hypothetical protein